MWVDHRSDRAGLLAAGVVVTVAFFAGVSAPIRAAQAEGPQEANAEPAEIIRLRHRELALRPGFPVDADVRDAGTGDRQHAYLWFFAPLGPQDHQRFDAESVEVLRSLGQHVVVASIRAGEGPDLVRQGLAMGGQPIPWKDKVDSVTLGLIEKGGEGLIPVTVQIFSDVSARAARERLAGDAESLGGEWPLFEVKWPAGRLQRLAEWDGVESLTAAPRPLLPLGEGGRHATATDAVQQIEYGASPGGIVPIYAGLSGLGVKVAICDFGMDVTHYDFFDPVTGASRVFYDSGLVDWHGTFGAGLAAGSGALCEAVHYPLYALRGHAPRAEIGNFPILYGVAQEFHFALEQHGSDFTSHAVAEGGLYGPYTGKTDEIIRGDATYNSAPISPRPALWAVGNSGTKPDVDGRVGYYATQAQFKNTITVGSVDALDGRVSRISSLGPTHDGRIKPDVMAAGATDSITQPPKGLYATASGQTYLRATGTSGAVSSVAGVLALLMKLRNKLNISTASMRPSTWRAILIHGARDLVQVEPPPPARRFPNPETNQPLRYHRGPDWASGHGVVDAARSARILEEGRFFEGTLTTPGSTHAWCFEVPKGAEEVKVVLAWDDPASSLYGYPKDPRLVHDLSLEVIRPDGTPLRPWVLHLPPHAQTFGDPDPISDADIKPAHRGVDDRNNVEVASEPHPAPGLWRAIVTAKSVNMGAQRYSLVSTDGMSLCLTIPPGGPGGTLCDRFPELCGGPAGLPKFDPESGTFTLPDRSLVPLDLICRYALNCPGCEGPSYAQCAPMRVGVMGLADGLSVVLADDLGVIHDESTVFGSAASVTSPPRARDRRFFFFVVDSAGRVLRRPADVSVLVTPIPRNE